MKDLDEQVYRYYWDKSLKDESIDALLNPEPKRRRHWLQVSTAVAAGIALFVAVMW